MEGVDFIIFRELTGGIYFGKKQMKLKMAAQKSMNVLYQRRDRKNCSSGFSICTKKKKKTNAG